MMLRFHTQTAGVSLTAQQPDNNVIRCTVQALSAILGRVAVPARQFPRRSAGPCPSEESAQISLRTQQILAYESGTADVVDPLGGSWYVESLTNDLEAQAFDYIRRIDEMGGAVSAIEGGFQMREIGDAAYRHRQEVESGDRIIVGVNRYVAEEPPVEGLMRVDEEAARQQVARLERLRRERDGSARRRLPWPGWGRWRAAMTTPCRQYWSALRRTAPSAKCQACFVRSLGSRRRWPRSRGVPLI